ncbi:hypothetical protein [Streptomyces sp. NPDC097619]|uniref:hypothetical protein n=1 Tax=Streptomyces sp. NPDC097619 TaxID=3157228 RepID=UPI003325D56B
MHRRNPALALAALAASSGALVITVPGTAAAHGDTVAVDITGQRRGHVLADVTWENDGDPVEERVAATVNAVSGDGSRTAGPWRLVRVPGTAAGWTTAEALPAGRWQVTIEVGFPDLGRGQGAVTVAAPAPRPTPPTTAGAPARTLAPAARRTGAPTAAPAAAAAPTRVHGTTDPGPGEDSAPGRTTWITAAGVAVAAVTGAAAGLLLRSRRTRRR